MTSNRRKRARGGHGTIRGKVNGDTGGGAVDFEGRLREIDALVAEHVREHGWHITGVFPVDPAGTFFSYTAGVSTTYSHPELIVFGVKPEVAHALFSTVIDQIREGRRFEDGERVEGLLSEDYSVFFRACPTHHESYPLTMSARYRKSWDFEALQIVLPDRDNRFPWDEGVEPQMAWSQQLLLPDHE